MPGGGALERDLIASGADRAVLAVDGLTDAFVGDVIARGVGFARTEAHVETDLRAAMDVYLPLVRAAIAEGLTAMVDDLKRESRLATGIT